MTSIDLYKSILLYRVISIICQTLVYGMYLCLIPISVYVMVTKGLQSRSRRWLFAMTSTMFALSSIYWILSVVVTFLVIRAWYSELDPVTNNMPNWLPMFSAILLVNYILTDGVVVWRAWVLCPDQKVVLVVPVVILIINTFVYLTTVVVRAGLLITPNGAQIHQVLSRIIDFAQVANLALSLLTNVLATSVIAVKAWKYRKSLIRSGFSDQISTPAARIISLLIESGMLYILISVSALVSLVIHLPFGTLGDIFMPVSVQLAGMYPIVVLILVDQSHSFNSTSYYSSDSIMDIRGERASRVEPIIFGPGPAVASGGQIDSEATKVNSSSGSTLKADKNARISRSSGQRSATS